MPCDRRDIDAATYGVARKRLLEMCYERRQTESTLAEVLCDYLGLGERCEALIAEVMEHARGLNE